MNDNISKSAKRGRLIMCLGPYCNAGNRAEMNAEILKPLLDELNDGELPPRYTLDYSGCMSMCGAGPNWIVPPDETICHYVDSETKIKRIVDEFLRD